MPTPTYSTSVPGIDWAPTGPVVPTESAVLTGMQADIDAAFGGGLNPGLNTPQGQLAQSVTAIVGAKNDDMLEVVNGVDPDTADGRFQDGIARIYFIERNPAEPTTIQVSCVGLAGTPIPVGALIADQNQNIYSCQQAGTIPASGQITLAFSCTTTGPITVPAANQISIYKAIPGWDSVSVVSGVTGQNVETRAAFEARRRASVAINSVGSIASVRAAVLSVPGVLDAYITDNGTGAPVPVGDFMLAPHSLYVGVYGGAAAAVAQAIWSKKAPGCNYNGNTTVTVYDTSAGSQPYPSYQVTFQTLAPTPILFSVQLVNNPNLPSNISTLVKNAIISAFTGVDGGAPAKSGGTIYSGRYFPGLMAIDSSVEPLSVQMGIAAANQNSLTMGIDQTPTITDSNISVMLV